MSETKSVGHTKGPWVVWINADGAFTVGLNDHTVICGRNAWNHRAVESRANARLIAAAPEMFEALDELAVAINEATESIDVEAALCSNRVAKARETARAALSKAKGGE